ncbi:TetR/AcrR family transcriptional regulator [Flavobacterium haoranii]|uniref:Transcriptional regulator, TetR family n=1 Tax=Flavobacterium haoranii TaxID=683124 RepID=A0A1M6KTW6_9FLAO|nr:TetR/AcrR family transcriptional regulator [Flavobacterium haoranii]SHJ62359.1 transcriptional regulator, TetR family [Flavobacterium haoranii]
MILSEKQIHIIDKSEKLFAEKGFDGTSIRDIAKEADINIAMISYYFGSKEKLLEAIVYYRISALKLLLNTLATEGIGPLEKINRLIEFYISKIYQNKTIYQIIHYEINNNKREFDLELFKQIKIDNIKTLTQIIKEGQNLGIFKEDIQVELIPPVIIGTLTQMNINQPFYSEILNLKTDEEYENYIKTTFTEFIKKTINSLILK